MIFDYLNILKKIIKMLRKTFTVGMELFERYLKGVKSYNMELYNACEHYKTLPKEDLCREARRIYVTYLNPWSQKFVRNISQN